MYNDFFTEDELEFFDFFDAHQNEINELLDTWHGLKNAIRELHEIQGD